MPRAVTNLTPKPTDSLSYEELLELRKEFTEIASITTARVCLFALEAVNAALFARGDHGRHSMVILGNKLTAASNPSYSDCYGGDVVPVSTRIKCAADRAHCF